LTLFLIATEVVILSASKDPSSLTESRKRILRCAQDDSLFLATPPTTLPYRTAT
jgi:hypothetical protein